MWPNFSPCIRILSMSMSMIDQFSHFKNRKIMQKEMYVNLKSHKRNENNQALYDTTYRRQTQDISIKF